MTVKKCITNVHILELMYKWYTSNDLCLYKKLNNNSMKVADLKIENNIKTEIHLNENNDFYEFLLREINKYESVFILSDNEISCQYFYQLFPLDKSKFLI